MSLPSYYKLLEGLPGLLGGPPSLGVAAAQPRPWGMLPWEQGEQLAAQRHNHVVTQFLVLGTLLQAGPVGAIFREQENCP